MRVITVITIIIIENYVPTVHTTYNAQEAKNEKKNYTTHGPTM